MWARFERTSSETTSLYCRCCLFLYLNHFFVIRVAAFMICTAQLLVVAIFSPFLRYFVRYYSCSLLPICHFAIFFFVNLSSIIIICNVWYKYVYVCVTCVLFRRQSLVLLFSIVSLFCNNFCWLLYWCSLDACIPPLLFKNRFSSLTNTKKYHIIYFAVWGNSQCFCQCCETISKTTIKAC